jgi:glycosyltransferase involved in cell wall biosynthesis
MMRVSVVIPARDCAATIGATLAALEAQELDPNEYEVIVVDDGSADGTAEVADRGAGPVKVIRGRDLGPAGARNAGVAAAQGEALAFTDADCVPQPGWLRTGLRTLERAELVQGAVRPAPGDTGGPFDHTIWVGGESGIYETANLFVDRELFERVGGFEDWLEPSFGKPFAEDVWFGAQARRAGARYLFCPEAVVHHAVMHRRGRDYVREQRRRGYFADIARRVPEIRGQLFFARYFLAPRTAAFDAALAGSVAALARRSPLPLVAAVPYSLMMMRRCLRWRSAGPRIALIDLAGDAVGFGSLVSRSLRTRTPVL